MLGKRKRESYLVRSPALDNLCEVSKRCRNGAIDLVGVELNPGPQSKLAAAKRALSALMPGQKKKKRVKGPKTPQQSPLRPMNSMPRGVGSPGRQQGAAAAYATGQYSGKAKVVQQSVDSTRMVHRELVGSLVGSVLFATPFSFSINPGLPAVFPWLATQAVGWEKYHFNYLRLCSYTRTGTNTPGSIILSPDYDAADAAPVSEQIASSYFGTQEDAPWKDICMDLDRNRLAGERFLRYGSLAANLDVKTYDVANVFVSTTDGTAVAWSKLWWEYDVTFYNPQLPPGGLSDNGTVLGAGVFSAAVPFGSLATVTGPLGVVVTGQTVTFSGLTIGAEYSLQAAFTGTVLTVVGSSFTGLTLKTAIAQIVNAAATIIVESFTLTATATVGSITFANTATTITGSNLIISSLIPAPAF